MTVYRIHFFWSTIVFSAEPPRNKCDLFFSIIGIPVRVHPLFWLASAVLGFQGTEGHPLWLCIWIGAVFVSILVHELGHAFAMRYYGWNPSVTLYLMGGLARYDSGFSSSFSSYKRPGNQGFAQIVIAAAGPAAGFLLAGLTVLATRLAGGSISFESVFPCVLGINNLSITKLIYDLLFINIFWGLLNLLPVYPLDGGQISRELFTWYNWREGIQNSLLLSVVVGAALALLGLVIFNNLFMGMLFGYLAFSSYQLLKACGGRGGFGGNPW